MRIGLLDTSVGNWGDGKFYNLQEVGLARELAAMAQEVVIYKAVDKKGLYTKRLPHYSLDPGSGKKQRDKRTLGLFRNGQHTGCYYLFF